MPIRGSWKVAIPSSSVRASSILEPAPAPEAMTRSIGTPPVRTRSPDPLNRATLIRGPLGSPTELVILWSTDAVAGWLSQPRLEPLEMAAAGWNAVATSMSALERTSALIRGMRFIKADSSLWRSMSANSGDAPVSPPADHGHDRTAKDSDHVERHAAGGDSGPHSRSGSRRPLAR